MAGKEAAAAEASEEPRRRPGRGPLRSLLVASTFPLDSRTCLDTGCNRPALVGELLCPVHLGLLTQEEMPDYLADAEARPRRLAWAAALALFLALMGVGIGAATQDPRFGWIGGLAAGAALTGAVSRELRFHRLAGLMGLLAFFMVVVLFASALLVGAIAALPWVLGNA